MRTLFRIPALATLAIGVVAMSAQAQGAKSFGILGGVDFATVTGSDADIFDYGSRVGFIGGLYMSIPVSASIAVEPEILYVKKGAEAPDSASLDLAYIEIPVLLKYNFNPDGGPYILAGLAVGFNTTCKFADVTDTDCADAPFSLETNTTFGGVLGLGFQKSRFGLEGRYDFDFGGVFKDYNAKNAVWEILARIMIK